MTRDQYQQLVIQALGRPSYLGQLYDAPSSTFLNENLLNGANIKPIKVAKPSTEVQFKEVKSLQERAESLEVAASLSVTIMGGAISASGFGSYLDRKDDSSESKTIAAVVRIRTHHHYLDIKSIQNAVVMADAELEMIRATHVVTAITFGGNVIGSLTEKDLKSDLKSDSKKEIKGKFCLGEFKDIVKGEAELSMEEKAKLDSYKFDVRLVADFLDPSAPVPTTAAEIVTFVRKTTSIVGEGVPCDIFLTPLVRVVKNSVTPLFCELADADLRNITDFYDRLITLNQNRTSLLAQFNEKYSTFFPSFVAECRARSDTVDQLLRHSRQELRVFLEDYRNQKSGTKSVAEFLSATTPPFKEEQKLYERDRTRSVDMLEKMRAADEHKFPLIAVESLPEEMNRMDNATIVLVLVPECVRVMSLVSTYRVLAGDIRKWRSMEDKYHSRGKEAAATVYFSVYADPQVDKDLLHLDCKNQSVLRALRTARANQETALLIFGLPQDNARELEWNVLNQDGWGVLLNKKEGWRYIGEIRGGLRHGRGVMTYADGTIYTGGWCQGRREGYGELSAADGAVGNPLEKGVYVDNRLRSDGIVVDTTVYDDGSPVNFARVALRSGDAVISHVAKIAQVLGWQLGQRFRMSLESSTGAFPAVYILVNGPHVSPAEHPRVAESYWPLNNDGEKKIKAHFLGGD